MPKTTNNENYDKKNKQLGGRESIIITKKKKDTKIIKKATLPNHFQSCVLSYVGRLIFAPSLSSSSYLDPILGSSRTRLQCRTKETK